MSDRPNEFLESIQRLTRDLRNAATTLSDREARFLVDSFYAMQKDRIRAAHQNRTLADNAEPHDVLGWLQAQRDTLERQIARALDAYSAGRPAGRWARSITGVGPIIAAGLLCHIDIERCPTVGHLWRFAGLDPTLTWDRNTKRPWNGSLKRLCFLIGESFVKVSNLESDFYGKYYQQRKAYEQAKNEAGDYADQARASLAAKRFGDDTQAKKHYLTGKLPPARIHRRAERWATKLFLSNLHCVTFFIRYDRLPPQPYPIDHLGHAHYIPPPNASLVPGLPEALATLPKG